MLSCSQDARKIGQDHSHMKWQTCVLNCDACCMHVDWRSLMPATREAAVELALSGELEITQKGQQVAPKNFKGPIRLRLKASLGN